MVEKHKACRVNRLFSWMIQGLIEVETDLMRQKSDKF